MKKIGIFGGSFNPIHNGHIALARQLRELADLNEVWLMVSPLNPLKQSSADLLPDHLRLQMAQLALQGETGLKASDYEFHLPKPSYTWNTLQALHNDYPNDVFTLLIGADNWQLFHHWRNYADILAHYPIVIYPRQGSPIDAASLPKGVQLVNTQLYNVSSTEVRCRIREGKPVDQLIPASIVERAQTYYAIHHGK